MIETRIRESVDAFVAAWNEHDAAARMRLLERACTDDVVMRTPGRRTNGRAELDALMADFQRRQPNKRAVFASRVDVQGGAFRYAGMVEDPSGTRTGDVLDAGDCDDDGKIRIVISFVGVELPT